MEKLKWWDKSIEEINSLIPILACSDLNKVREELKKIIWKELNISEIKSSLLSENKLKLRTQ